MTYDPMNRLTRVNNTKGESTLSVYSYQYDNNGNITSVTEQVKDGALQTSTYSYDKLSRLIGVKRADGTETQYSYDLRGNRLTQKDTSDLPDEKAMNYRYDLQNTLISVTKDSVKTALDYLPDGLRWKKTSGSKVTKYSYNGADQVIGDQTSNGTISSYIRGDRVLVKKDLTNQKDYYYLYNGHGDVVQMVGTDGSLVNSYQYDEWGNLTQQKETVANEFKYAGETYDAETGLYYLKARYYEPNAGCFLNEDTYEGQIDNPLSQNLYTYVHNNPLIYTDPTGHSIPDDTHLNVTLQNKIRQVTNEFNRAQRRGDTAGMQAAHDKAVAIRIASGDYELVNHMNYTTGKSTPYGTGYGGAHVDNSWTGFVYDSIITGGLGGIERKAATEAVEAPSLVKSLIAKCNCFTAGTKVKTNHGEKNIEDIKIGDQVLSKDEKTGEVKYKEVTATFNHKTDDIYKISIGDQVIESTFNHPFYVRGKGWTFVKDLKVGDLLVQSDGNTLKIDSIELEHKHVTVYNMTVDEFHTYFVSDLGIWVHNTGPCGLSATTLATMGKTSKGVAGLEDAYISKDKVLDTVKEFVGEDYSKGVAKNGYTTYVSKNGNYVARYGYKKDGSLELNLENDIGGNFHIEVK